VSLLLKASKDKFVHTKRHLGTDDDLIFSKGIFPYNCMTGPEKFPKTQLPPIHCFYDKLKDKPLKEEKYERAKATWDLFGIKTLKEYHDHYLMTDVLPLSDVIEHFRETVYEAHSLDCLHFSTLPSLAWQMALKHTGVQLDLFTDPDAYLMLENNMRGGVRSPRLYLVAGPPRFFLIIIWKCNYSLNFSLATPVYLYVCVRHVNNKLLVTKMIYYIQFRYENRDIIYIQ